MNEENKKQFIALGVLGLLLVGVLGKSLLGSPDTADARPTDGAAGSDAQNITLAGGSVFEEIDVDIQELGQNIKEVTFNYEDARAARNPAAPLVGSYAVFNKMYDIEDGEEASTDNLLYEANRKHLTGIIWDETNPVAVIDNEVVSVGYRFEEPISVKSIGQDHVVLTIADEGLDVIRELKEQ